MAVADVGAQLAKQMRGASTAKLGSPTTDLVFVGFTPCRVVDTRNSGLGISAGTQRNFYYYSDGNPGSWSTQGGDPGAASTACPNTVFTSAGGTLGNVAPAVAMANITAVNTTAAGNFIVWGGSAGAIPNTSVLNWDHGGEVISKDLTDEQRKAYYDAENKAVDLINANFYKYAHHVAAATKGALQPNELLKAFVRYKHVDYYDQTTFGRAYDWMKDRGLTEGQSQHSTFVPH